MLKELFLSSILSLSIGVRTPNDDTKPVDYEYSISAEKNKGKFTYFEKLDYERELGEKYLDFIGKYNYRFNNHLFLGLDHIEKESKDIYYTTYNIGWQNKNFKTGISFKDEQPLLNFGFRGVKKDKENKMLFGLGMTCKTDFNDEKIINLKTEIKKWFTGDEKVNIFCRYNLEYYNDKKDFQFKVGVGVKLQ